MGRWCRSKASSWFEFPYETSLYWDDEVFLQSGIRRAAPCRALPLGSDIRRFVRSVNVFPIFALGPIREREQQPQEQHHEHPDMNARVPRRLGHVIEIVHKIGDE